MKTASRIYKKEGGWFLATRDGVEKRAVVPHQGWENEPIEVLLAWEEFETELSGWSPSEIVQEMIGDLNKACFEKAGRMRSMYWTAKGFLPAEKVDGFFDACVEMRASAKWIATASVWQEREAYVSEGNPDRDWMGGGGKAPGQDFRSIQDRHIREQRARESGNPVGYTVKADAIEVCGERYRVHPERDITDAFPFTGVFGVVEIPL